MSHYPVQKFLPNSMKRSSSILLILSLFAGQLHAGGGGGIDQGYYTEELKYQTRPNPDGERFFGVIGTTGLKVRVYPGVVLKVEEMVPGSPSEGKFAKGEILTGINGTALKGLDPFVAMGNALTKAEATDGRMVFDVTSADGKTQAQGNRHDSRAWCLQQDLAAGLQEVKTHHR